MFFEVIPLEVFRLGGSTLTYSSDQNLLPGQLVLIPLGRKTVTGIVFRRVKNVDFSTKPISRLITPIPIPNHLLKAIFWLSEYYLTPLPTAANLFIPPGLAARTTAKFLEKTFPNSSSFPPKSSPTLPEAPRGRKQPPKSKSATRQPSAKNSPLRASEAPNTPNCLKLPLIDLNSAQQKALQSLQETPGHTSLLRGVTGSGKTNIYLQLASEALQRGESTILLVPEIALTSQLIKIFEATFGQRVLLIHSRQTPAERRQIWLDILLRTSDWSQESRTRADIANTHQSGLYSSRESPEATAEDEDARHQGRRDGATSCPKKSMNQTGEPLIIIGPRSALLTPVGNLGQIIIDESHESAYYQENAPRYSALRLASFIAGTLKISCLQGTATPNLVDYHLAKTHHSLVELSEKAKSTAITPDFSIIDLRDRANFCKNRYFSDKLLTTITNNLQHHHQTLIFHNRRGSAPMTLCEECGWQALCPNCYLPLALHADDYSLNCHVCGHSAKVPTSCPECQHPSVIHKGIGTQLLATELARLFPKAKLARFDGDNRRDEGLADLYSAVKTGEIDLLIGTQTLARGLDLPHLATVGIIQADAGLALPDFAAEERAFELLTQVIGRVGRGHLSTANVILQTYQPDHPVIKAAIAANFPEFATYELKRRRAGHLPPFTYLAKLVITYKTEKTTISKIQAARTALSQNPHLTVSPPMPAFHERTGRGYTWQIILKSTSRNQLLSALKPFAKYHIEIDPPSLL